MKMNIKTIGILGGGQLGRMSALAASRLGMRTHIYCPEENCPASHVTDLFTCASYEDISKFKEFATNVDVISYEFENIPLEAIEVLSGTKPVYPDANLLMVSQNRLKEKSFLNQSGIKTAPWSPATSAADIDRFMEQQKAQNCIIKTSRFGYDGKGQIKHGIKDNSADSWAKLNTNEAIIEGVIDFAYECSVIVARDVFGTIETFPIALNNHKNHILSESIAPVNLAERFGPAHAHVESTAIDMATTLAKSVNLVGLAALELFVSKDGEVFANEIAPRTHNSGHWTMDGCNVSQFEQHIRAISGLPVLKPIAHSEVTMINLIGDDVKTLDAYYGRADAAIHLYGKAESREGRKMGHINITKPLEKK